MAPVAMGCGVLLVLLGVGFYLGTDRVSPTPLIPAAFGVVFFILGLLARRDRLRMHVMHAAALLGLAGVGIPLWRLWPAISTGEVKSVPATVELALMAGICAVFVALCVRSFIMARRSRRQNPVS